MAELRTCLGVLFLLSFSPAQAFGRITQLPRRTAPVGATSIPAVAAAAVRPWEAPAPRVPQPQLRPIVIDAGHGGKAWGAMITGRYEKDITLAVALKLRDHLQALGLGPVRMTRDSDEFIPLNGRVDDTSAWGGGLFISLHANKVFRHGPHGIMVYSFGRGNGRSDRHHQVTGMGDARITKQAFQVALRNRAEIAVKNRDARNDNEQIRPMCRHARSSGEQHSQQQNKPGGFGTDGEKRGRRRRRAEP